MHGYTGALSCCSEGAGSKAMCAGQLCWGRTGAAYCTKMAGKKAMTAGQAAVACLSALDVVREGGSKMALLYAGKEKGIGPGARLSRPWLA